MIMKYTLVAFEIINMGGEQQYCRNKLKAMSDLGYKVNLISATDGTVYIEELKPYSKNVFPELKYPVFCFSKRHVMRVVDHIASMIGECDNNSIIESVNIATAEWSELIAQRLRCRHVCFALDEAFTVSPSESSYLKFKYDRRELVGIAVQTLQIMFKGYYNIPDNESYFFDAACTNVLADYSYSPEWLSKAKTNSSVIIGSIGRLEKGFVIPALKQIIQYIENDKENLYTIIMIGGTEDKVIEKKIKLLFKDVSNAELFITGYIYPLPISLVSSLDVCFSTASSTLITAIDIGIPTISVDTFTGQPIGILDYTTTETMYADENDTTTFRDLLDRILKDDYCKKHERKGMEGSKMDDSFITEVKRELEFVQKQKNLQYYDTTTLKPMSIKYKAYSLIGKTLGIQMLEIVRRNLLHNLKMLTKGKQRENVLS